MDLLVAVLQQRARLQISRLSVLLPSVLVLRGINLLIRFLIISIFVDQGYRATAAPKWVFHPEFHKDNDICLQALPLPRQQLQG